MKQLHVVQSIATDFGGLGVAALRHAQAQALVGEDVTLYILNRHANELDTHHSSRTWHIRGTPETGLIRQMLDLIRCLWRGDFDFIHIHGTWTPLLAFVSYLSFAMRIPVVVSPHGCLETEALKHRGIKKKLALVFYQKRIFLKARMMMATAKQELLSIRRLGITTPIAIIPLGVDTPRSQPHQASELRTFLFLSRIHPIKGLRDLVQAWARVRRAGWRVIVAGPDENGHLQEILGLIDSLGLRQDFEFVGLVSGQQKESLFAQSDFFVLPTYSENFGLVVAEALSRGIPVITTTGAPWEDIARWQCGWWVHPGIEGISHALMSAMETSPEETSEMGKRGIRLINEKYSWSKIGLSALHAYRWMLDQSLQRPDFIDIRH